MRHDEKLRAKFRAMRDEEAEAAPPFSVPAPRRRTVPAARVAAAVAGAAIVIAAAWLLLERPADEDALAFLQLDRTEWVGPTDFLLDIGNRRLLTTIPEIGEAPGPEAAGPESSGARDTLKTEGRRS